ncbi:MAG: VTT domain-containing protein [Patescibacteria group bacterium]
MKRKSAYETIIVGTIIAIILFVLVAFVVQENKEAVSSFVSAGGWFSISIYVFFGILAIVVPLATNIFLIPIGTATWGPIMTGFLNILGWTLGSMIAFFLARKFGEQLHHKFPRLFEFPLVEKIIGTKYQLLTLIFIRLSFPVDIVSYAIGFFTKIKFSLYIMATIIGIAPFAFFYAYASEIPFSTTISFISGALVLFCIFVFIRLILIKMEGGGRGHGKF